MADPADLTARIAEVLRIERDKQIEHGIDVDVFHDLAAAVVAELGLNQFYAVDYGDGEISEATWEHWDEARDHAADGPGDDLGDSKIVTGWFTGWQDAQVPATRPLI